MRYVDWQSRTRGLSQIWLQVGEESPNVFFSLIPLNIFRICGVFINKVLQGFLSIFWNTAMLFSHPRTFSLNLVISKTFFNGYMAGDL
jgi:hypothetical protein